MDETTAIPRATLERLPTYLRDLVRTLANGEILVSSESLAESASVHPAQVRKDLRYIGQSGTPGVGYDVRRLIYEVEDILGLSKPKEAVLAGAGRLGAALSQYPGFDRFGLKIVALFDIDESKVGGRVGDKSILPLAKLSDLPLRMGIRMGIICVPAEAAQKVADLMVAAGIKVIWNFAPTQLRVPAEVFVRNEDLAAQLATLSYHLAQHQRLTKSLDSAESVESAESMEAEEVGVESRRSTA